MRKAGELIKEYLREGQLAANRSEPIGTGGNAVVYASDVPGNVMKQSHQPDGLFPTCTDFIELMKQTCKLWLQRWALLLVLLGIETFPGGIGNRIEMADVRPNFEPAQD